MSLEESQEPSVTRLPFEIELSPGRVLRGDVRRPSGRDADAAIPGAGSARWDEARAIVVCHGFKGFKDWGFFPHLAERLAMGTRSTVVSFNFSGSGVGPDLETFSDLEGFARNTFTKELEDLETILDALGAARVGGVPVHAPDRVGLIGHSRGAASVVLAAARRAEARALVTWAGIGSVFRYEDWLAEGLGEGDLMHVVNARTGQRLALHRDALDDMRANRELLDMRAAGARLGAPLLIVHGSEDEAVPLSDAELLLDSAGSLARLSVIEGAGHTMGASHPFPGTNPYLDEAVELTLNHFNRYLGEAGS
jgi:pimeloyl-ACP methyl ester carboxylesterase